MAANSYPEFHQGAAGYARYFWHAAVDQTDENYMVEFIFPVVTREDTRYYTLGRGRVREADRIRAESCAVITRNDAGNEVFNISEVVMERAQRQVCRACIIQRANGVSAIQPASGGLTLGSTRFPLWRASFGPTSIAASSMAKAMSIPCSDEKRAAQRGLRSSRL